MVRKTLLITLLFFSSLQQAWAQEAGIASAHPLATQAGITVLKQGGNAFDAAVAVTAALAVVEPYGSGLGGGGFWLLHRASDNHTVMLDGRETAPLAAHPKLYQDEQGNVIPKASMDGALAAGIPGEPAALVYLAKHYGRLPLKQSLQPAIKLAQDGFPLDKEWLKMLGFRKDAIQASAASSAVFLKEGELPEIDSLIQQKDLAYTLNLLAEKGKAGFYAGEIAQKLVQGVQKDGGIWSLKDLANYRVSLRRPITGEYHGMRISSAAPPSSGGIVLLEILNILAAYPLHQTGAGKALDNATRIHLITEAMRRAYRDRAAYLGDPDFVEMPITRLVSKEYAAGLRASINFTQKTASNLLAPVSQAIPQGDNTTHFSIIDGEGNRVAATLSVNYPFGSGFMPEGTGVLLNNEMDDFSAKPGSPNAYGLIGATANAIQPGKRMLSSMSPTFLETDNRLAVVGTPGGSRIITMVLLASLEFFDGKNATEIAAYPRFHHQYLPDTIYFEADAVDSTSVKALQKMGHQLELQQRSWGNMQLLIQDKSTGKIDAASDPRGIGLAMQISLIKN